jgi:hypothetical protein
MFIYISSLGLIFEFNKSVPELDACVTAVAEGHVVRGPTAAERYAIPHFVRYAVLRFDPYATPNPQRATAAKRRIFNDTNGRRKLMFNLLSSLLVVQN